MHKLYKKIFMGVAVLLSHVLYGMKTQEHSETWALLLPSLSYELAHQQPEIFISPLFLSARLNLLILAYRTTAATNPSSLYQLSPTLKNNFTLLCNCIESYVNPSYPITHDFTLSLLSQLKILTLSHTLETSAKKFYTPPSLEYVEKQSLYELTQAILVSFLQIDKKNGVTHPTIDSYYKAYYAFYDLLRNSKSPLKDPTTKKILQQEGLLNSQGNIYYIIRASWEKHHKE